jgi:hypothetical protein
MPEETAGDYKNQRGKTSSAVMLSVYGFVSLASDQRTAVMYTVRDETMVCQTNHIFNYTDLFSSPLHTNN